LKRRIILKYAGDYNTSKSRTDLILQLLTLLTEDNVDPYFKRQFPYQRVVSQWQLILIEETYLQVAKQTINNLKGEEKVPFLPPK
jgi:hypothetical protein